MTVSTRERGADDAGARRRTPAPDIAACILLLFGASLIFSVLKALYSRTPSAAVQGLVGAGGLLVVCAVLARGLLLRQGYAAPGALLALAVAAVAAVTGFYIPETAQLPAGLLSLFGISLLLPSLREFAPAGDSDTAGT